MKKASNQIKSYKSQEYNHRNGHFCCPSILKIRIISVNPGKMTLIYDHKVIISQYSNVTEML